jgi:hypothetical protein
MPLNLFSSLKSKDENNLNFVQKLKYSYINTNKSKDEKILEEKRRRHQIYILLDYILSNSTYFDFFTSDTFQILIFTKYLGAICLSAEKFIGSEFLLFTFLNLDLPIQKILQEYNLNQKEIGLFISSVNKLSPKSFMQKKDFYFRKVWKDYPINEIKPLKYAHETNLIFEKAAENALSRFKTPVITPEILFISLMEEKNFLIGKLIKKELLDETNWYLLRYKLLKKLYNQEVIIKSEIKKSHQFFAYLLKTQISEANFQKLIEKKALEKAVSLFRNYVIRDVLKSNFLIR